MSKTRLNTFLKKLLPFVKARLPLIVFILIYIFVVLNIYQDFGITWDERDAFSSGQELYNHLQGEPNGMFHRDFSKEHANVLIALYNHLYPATVYGISDKLLNSTTHETFHLLNLLFPTVLFICFYELLYSRYKSSVLALSAPLLLVISGRFIGDVPTNARDGSFAILFSIALCGIYISPKIKSNILKAVVLGVLFGFALTSRVLGLTLPLIYLLFTTYYHVLNKELDIRSITSLIKFGAREALNLTVVTIISLFILVTTSPYLGSNFLYNFKTMLAKSSNLISTFTVLFKGEIESASDLPFDYLPTWIAITTPIFILILFILSPIIVKRFWRNQLYSLFAIALVINILLYYFKQPVIFDAYRHYLFLYPLIVLLSSIAIIELIKKVDLRTGIAKETLKVKWNIFVAIFVTFIAINTGLVIKDLYELHPYQYLYFNESVGGLKGADGEFETDYWGATFKEAINWLEENKIEEDKTYSILTCGHPFQSAYYFSENMKWIAEFEDADFFVCYTRYYQNTETLEQYGLSDLEPVYVVERDGVGLNYVYEL